MAIGFIIYWTKNIKASLIIVVCNVQRVIWVLKFKNKDDALAFMLTQTSGSQEKMGTHIPVCKQHLHKRL